MDARVSSKSSRAIPPSPPPSGKPTRRPSQYNMISAPPARRVNRGSSKRCFRQFSVKDPFIAKANEAYRIDHSPSQLSMSAVKLRILEQPLGMDGIRRENQRNILWYWQWSRSWNLRSAPTTPRIAADTTLLEVNTNGEHTSLQLSVRYWRWQEKQRRLKNTLRKKIPIRLYKDAARYFGPSRSA